MEHSNRLALGTVQFGIPYGISNVRGKVPADEAAKILEDAWARGIDTLDTAPAYGDSERTIGEVLSDSRRPFRIVTKLDNAVGPEESILASAARLRVTNVYATLVHNFVHFERQATLWDGLRAARDEGLCAKIGFSLYYPRELDQLLDAGVDVDILQLPYSLFDRRFEDYLPLLQRAEIEVHARSVFLQGLAFMPAETLPEGLSVAREKLRRLRSLSAEYGTTIASICLKFAFARPEIDRVLIGVDSLENLRENLAAASGKNLPALLMNDAEGLAIDDERVTVPSNWTR